MRSKTLLLAAVGEGSSVPATVWAEHFAYPDGALPTTGTYTAGGGAIVGTSVWLAYNDGVLEPVPTIAAGVATGTDVANESHAARGVGSDDTVRLTFTATGPAAADTAGVAFYVTGVGEVDLVVINGNLVSGVLAYSAAFTGPTAALQITQSTGAYSIYDNGVLKASGAVGAVVVEAALLRLNSAAGAGTLDDVILT